MGIQNELCVVVQCPLPEYSLGRVEGRIWCLNHSTCHSCRLDYVRAALLGSMAATNSGGKGVRAVCLLIYSEDLGGMESWEFRKAREPNKDPKQWHPEQ